MPELTITAVMPDTDATEEAEALDRLMSMLAVEAGKLAELGRRPGFGQTEGALRVFSARFTEQDALAALLRATGGWHMRHPWATVTLKIESSKGGKNLQLKNYSPLAMAQAAVDLREYLEV